ncbi:MAG: hypothetical protein Q4G67_00410 [Actinomycetia bacterium]|nr:hypothetical protein [Actinomycetes bacterium]
MNSVDEVLRETLDEDARAVPHDELLLSRVRTAARRQDRLRRLRIGAAAAAALVVAAVLGSQFLPDRSTPLRPAGSDSPVAETFEVPTYAWDQEAGMAALLSGRLAITPEGCTLLVPLEGGGLPQPVVFPNAVGVQYSNGVRAVVQQSTLDVYAVEGQEFSYGGGAVPAGESWTGHCGDYELDDVNVINDVPATPALTESPEPYEGELPDRIPSEEERGWYAVPTFEWDPEQAGDGLVIAGPVTMTSDGCATVVGAEAAEPLVTGLVFPNAQGTRSPTYAPDGTSAILSWFPESMSVMAADDMEVRFERVVQVETSSALAMQWESLCPNSPVDALVQVYDEFPH